jgi:4-hydroxybutyrate CoA-transferase
MTFTAPADAFADLRPGTRVVAGNACGTPLTLLRALAARAEQVGQITLSAGLLLGDISLEPVLRSGRLALRSWHLHGDLRRLYREGLVDYLPLRLLDLADVVLRDIDVALIRVSPPDADGWCSVGPSATFARAAVERAALVIAEVSADVPRTCGDSSVHISAVDRFVQAEGAMAYYRPGAGDEVSLAVARNVMTLIPHEATVQLGIGTVPEALAAVLAEHADELSLGLLGLVTESMLPLVEAVCAGGRGPVQAIELMGGAALMSWADRNPMIEMRSSRELHNPLVLSAVPKLVSINSAVAVDLFGQVIAESVRGSVAAGVGGSADFSEGAHLSSEGLRITALKSTTRKGDSTIVVRHHVDDTVTAPHHSVDAVVTEHGVAALRGRTRRERQAALIAIAAPSHRDFLAGRPA